MNFEIESVENAYLSILKDDIDTARQIFERMDSPRAKWGLIFVDLIKGVLTKYPTYFEIRNFLEIDLDFLLKNKKIEYIEQLLGGVELLVQINQEIYKYIARVMFENGFYNVTKKYLDKSKDLTYNDPELHFIYTKYYIKLNNYRLAYHHINECLKILPNYYPAKIIKKELEADSLF